MSRKPRVEFTETSTVPDGERAEVKAAFAKDGFRPRRRIGAVPVETMTRSELDKWKVLQARREAEETDWIFRTMGKDARRITVRAKTWHVARANAAAVLQVEPSELALVEGGR